MSAQHEGELGKWTAVDVASALIAFPLMSIAFTLPFIVLVIVAHIGLLAFECAEQCLSLAVRWLGAVLW